MAKEGFFRKNKYAFSLLIIILVLFGITAINPPYPQDFFYEHIMTIVFFVLMIFSYKYFRLSNLSYTLIFAFLILHIIGARFTYSEVPYPQFFMNYFNFDIQEFFGWERNHYDRLVHFSFGLLFAYPLRELFWRVAQAKGIWRYYLPLELVMAFSMLYELIEYGFAVIVGGDVGQSYLGTQGDEWDAQKDMLLATLGGLITLSVTFFVNLFYKGFKNELKDSLKISRKTPLGEVELRRLKKRAGR
ncbi:MAG: DUF2238 domain-containing protein [Nanoarchaeota archaeon]|nr:DUF2238 domain-containing protein [Nanoarchaeota archaeon]